MPGHAESGSAEQAALGALAARLWPHRLHESNCLLNLLCAVGLHRWMRIDLNAWTTVNDVRCCYWCDKVKVDSRVQGG